MTRVFVDTNVLFPFSVMDLILALTEDGVHDIVWTDALLAEWEHVIVAAQRRSAESARAITTAIRQFFPEGRISATDYVGIVAQMPGPDPDDRHHMAAAVAARASLIITWNRTDFPSDALAVHGVRVLDPDEYFCELVSAYPHEVSDTVIRLAGEKRRPPLTPYDVAVSLAKAGLSNFSARLMDQLDLRLPTTGTSGTPAGRAPE
jgi:predicted nucleic acid-binding protein